MADVFRTVSLSYKKAPLEIREQISLSESDCKAFYLKMKDVFDIQECLILSTCNRTEVYYKSEESKSDEIIKLLSTFKNLEFKAIIDYFEFIDNETKAINYLFEVALGLQSQVIGDLQIPNQIKQAYQWSADMNMSGPFIHRLLHSVFFANKRIVQETSFRDGAASTSYVTVDLMEGFLPLLKSPKILVLGLGEIGVDVAKTLSEKNHNNITLCNRTLEKSNELAVTYNYEVLPYEHFETKFHKYDVIISSLRLEKPLISAELINTQKLKSVSYFFDLSVPRSINPDIETVPGVVLYGLDEIQKRSSEAVEKRLEAVPAVKEIIAEMAAEMNNWTKELVVSPTIQKLKNALEQIRKEEVSRYLKGMSKPEIEKMEKVTSAMMQKIIKLPVLQLKAACQRGEAETLIDVLNDIFNLEGKSV